MTLDTIHLQLADFTVSEENSLTVQPAPYLAETGDRLFDRHLFTDSAGREHTGTKAYLNVPDRFQLSMLPFKKAVRQFSLPLKRNFGTMAFTQN